MFSGEEIRQLMEKVPWMQVSLTFALLVVAFFVSKLSKRLIKRRVARKPEIEKTFWSEFWRKEQKFVLRSVGWVVWLVFIALTLYIWSSYITDLFVRLQNVYAPIVRAIIIIIIAAIALKADNYLINYIIEQVTPITERRTTRGKQRSQTLHHIFMYGSNILITVVAILMLLDTFGISLKAVLATVGVASLAVGFGAQSLIKDIVSGIFILIEDQYAVGDVVIINGEGGFVENMTLRVTQMRNTEGMLITVPNGQVDMVKNLTSEWSRVDYMMDVAYETDLDHAIAVIMDEAGKLKNDMPDKIIADPELKGVDSFNDSSITIRVWIKTQPLMQWDVKRELNRRIHKRFDKEGITIPFPQRTVWVKEPKEEELLKALATQKTRGTA